jgi:hypothetical protein
MTEYFGHIRGGLTTYVEGADDGGATECRRMLVYHGEDVAQCVRQFWREHNGDFVIIPETGYGVAPRQELCSQKSLVPALQTADIEPGSRIEQQWKACCEHYHVAWPKRLQAA